MLQHATWDCWIHERDVRIPLGLSTTAEPDEIRSCLTYAAALAPALGIGHGERYDGSYGIETSNPHSIFLVEITDSVAVTEVTSTPDVPTLRGDYVELIESLSLRAPLPTSAPAGWRLLLGGLAATFDAEVPA